MTKQDLEGQILLLLIQYPYQKNWTFIKTDNQN